METFDQCRARVRGNAARAKERGDGARQLDLYGDVALPTHGADVPHDVARALAHDSGVFASSHGTVLTRCDAHCHSKASSGPAIKALGYIGCPESYSEPEHVFDQARERGMDLVAITDHDTIDGAMALVARGFPGVVVGEEVTVYFPEDRCKLHVLVWTLTPEQHEKIAALNLRDDVYAFAAWLHEENLPHALAHPLYVQNRKLTKWHLDRCALLFKGFETLNGAHSGTHRGALEAYLESLTPGRVHRLIDEVGIQPKWSRVWEKARTGGSDDHGLLNVGRTWTGVRGEEKILDGVAFFKAVMAGRGEPGGVAGHSSLLAHQLTTVGARYAAERILPKASPTARYVAKRAMRLVGVEVEAPATWRVGLDYVKGQVARRVFGKRRRLDPLLEAVKAHVGPVLKAYPEVLTRMQAFDGRGDGVRDARARGSAASAHEEFAAFADAMYAAVHGALSEGAVRAVKARDGRSIADHLASYLVLEATQLPYLFSLFHQNKERALVDQIAHESAAPGDVAAGGGRPLRVMVFTDTLGDVNGVSRFIRNVAEQARKTGRDLTVVTSTRFEVPQAANIVNVAPVFAMKMPKYEQLEVALPPLVKMLRLADQFQPDVIHCSTPGPVGTVGLVAAKMLRVPVAGVYHTDFPAYIDHLFSDESTTWATTQSMRAFYAGFRAVFTRSEDYVQSLMRLGVERHRIIPLKPGIMVEQFQPRFATEGLFARMEGQKVLGPDRARRDGMEKGEIVRVLFAGRVSVEKNLPMLVEAWKIADARLAARGVGGVGGVGWVMAELVVAGDGPYREEMERALRGTRARFLGFRHGEELSRVYATCDVFAFPSVTDTLGQVVMESQSSGLAVLVTDQGGPKEMVRDGETGFVIPTAMEADDPASIAAWAARIEGLVVDGAMRARMGRAAHEAMQPYSMEHSFEHYWRVHEAVKKDALWRRGGAPAAQGGPGVPLATFAHVGSEADRSDRD